MEYVYKALRDCTVRDNFHFEGEVFTSPSKIDRSCVQLVKQPESGETAKKSK